MIQRMAQFSLYVHKGGLKPHAFIHSYITVLNTFYADDP